MSLGNSDHLPPGQNNHIDEFVLRAGARPLRNPGLRAAITVAYAAQTLVRAMCEVKGSGHVEQIKEFFHPIHKRPHRHDRPILHAKNNRVVVERWEVDVTATLYATLNSRRRLFCQ